MNQSYISLNHSLKNMTIVYQKGSHPKKIILTPKDIEMIARELNSPVIDQMVLLFPNVFKMTVNAHFRRNYLDIIHGRPYFDSPFILSEEFKNLPFVFLPSGMLSFESKAILSISKNVTYEDLKRFINVAHKELESLQRRISRFIREVGDERHLFFVNGSYCYYESNMDDISVLSDEEKDAMIESLLSITQKDFDYFLSQIQPSFGLFDVEGLTDFDYIEKSTLNALQHARSLHHEINGKLTVQQVIDFVNKNGLGITKTSQFS